MLISHAIEISLNFKALSAEEEKTKQMANNKPIHEVNYIHDIENIFDFIRSLALMNSNNLIVSISRPDFIVFFAMHKFFDQL